MYEHFSSDQRVWNAAALLAMTTDCTLVKAFDEISATASDLGVDDVDVAAFVEITAALPTV